MPSKRPIIFDPASGPQHLQPGDLLDAPVPTQPIIDNSDIAASTAFAQKLLKQSMAAVTLSNITGGVHNFCSNGINGAISFTTIGGVITAVNSIDIAGTGYAIGDLVTPVGGNYDAVLRITTISVTGIASLNILNGGTGYNTANVVLLLQSLTSGFHFFINGALTSNAVFLIPGSSYIENANQWLVSNNTTGLFSIKFQLCVMHAPVGVGVSIPQNLAINVRSYLLATDGKTEMWLVNANTLQKKHGAIAQISGNTIIPFSNATPLVTQGTQIFSATIVPTMLGSDVVIDFSGTVDGSNTNSIITVALFRNNVFIGFCSTSPYSRGNSSPGSLALKVNDVVTSLVPITYSARIGIDTAGTWYLGRGATVTMGGINNSNWSIIEELT